MAAPSKAEQDILEIAYAGGNPPGGYVIDPTAGVARKMTAEETKTAEQAVADEAANTKRRAALLKGNDVPTPNNDPGVVTDAGR